MYILQKYISTKFQNSSHSTGIEALVWIYNIQKGIPAGGKGVGGVAEHLPADVAPRH